MERLKKFFKVTPKNFRNAWKGKEKKRHKEHCENEAFIYDNRTRSSVQSGASDSMDEEQVFPYVTTTGLSYDQMIGLYQQKPRQTKSSIVVRSWNLFNSTGPDDVFFFRILILLNELSREGSVRGPEEGEWVLPEELCPGLPSSGCHLVTRRKSKVSIRNLLKLIHFLDKKRMIKFDCRGLRSKRSCLTVALEGPSHG